MTATGPGRADDAHGTADHLRSAWREYCAALERLGDEILSERYPGSSRDVVDGFRHLATQAAGWTNWAVGHSDPDTPAFFRQNDLVMRWGGPNVDQVTRRARVEPSGVYRISGRLGSCEDFILTLKDGDMHAGRYGIAHEVMGSELGYVVGDDVEIVISAERPPDLADDVHWTPLPPNATLLNIREYYWNWSPEPPAVFTIERLDRRGSTPRLLDADALSHALDEAIDLVTNSIRYWNEWVEQRRAELPPNTMGRPGGADGGSSRVRYSFGFFDLAPDEALVIEADPADARFRDVQLYSLGWFESLDFANRITSLNHTQSHTSSDGLVRIVVAHRDPGVPNWLDTEARPRGMVTHRWIGADAEPFIRASCVPFDVVRDVLPHETPSVTPDQRAAEIQARRAHVAWRYRT